MNIIFIFIFAVIISVLIYFFKYGFTPKDNQTEAKTEKNAVSGGKLPCILCGAYLLKGEKLKSEEYKSDSDSLVKIYGCPHCYGINAVNRRKCPVCGKFLSQDQYLSGRMFYRKDKKPHLHVNGCQNCRGK